MSAGNREDDAFLGVGRMVSWSVYFSRPHLNGKFIYIIIFILYIDKSFILPF
jgi:hypothetical protein